MPGAEALPARLPPPEARPGGDRRAEFQRAEAPQRCGDGCAQDPACAWGCFFEAEERVPEARRSAEADCLFCGRETGFLDSPVLMAAVDGKALTLTWSPVDEADDYVVHGVRWDTEADETAPLRSHAWRTEDTRLSLEPEPGTWTFYVIAYRGQPKARSLRSNIVDLDL